MDDANTLYDKIKNYGAEAKGEADAFVNSLAKNYTKENPAPGEVIQKGLKDILAKHQPKTKSPVGHAGTFPGRMQYATGLATVLIAVALASSGIPYIPPPLY